MYEFATVFGSCGNDAVDRLNISDIKVSELNRTVDVEFADEMSDATKRLAAAQARKSFDENVRIRLLPGAAERRGDRNIMYYTMPQGKEIGKPEVTGKICVIGARLREEKLAELFACK